MTPEAATQLFGYAGTAGITIVITIFVLLLRGAHAEIKELKDKEEGKVSRKEFVMCRQEAGECKERTMKALSEITQTLKEIFQEIRQINGGQRA